MSARVSEFYLPNHPVPLLPPSLPLCDKNEAHVQQINFAKFSFSFRFRMQHAMFATRKT